MNSTIEYAHPIDEPCPPGCPTRLDEIAAELTEYFSAYGGITITPDGIREALCTPADARDSVQRIIAERESSWV